MFDSLVQAYDQIKRRAAQSGRPVTQEEMTKALTPFYLQYAKDATTARGLDLAEKNMNLNADLKRQALAQEQGQFNRELDFENSVRNDARPIQWLNLGVSGLGALGTSMYMDRQNDLYRQKLNLLTQMYGGAR